MKSILNSDILIRADGSPEIGLGHLVRCSALAHMLKGDFDISFYCKEIPDKLLNEFKTDGFHCKKISDEKEFINRLSKNTIAVLDGYRFDIEYQKLIKTKGAKLVCIDDLHDKEFVADLIINHAPGITPKDYRVQPYTQFALGLEHALLRPAFLEQARKTRRIDEIETLFICFGGSDLKNFTQGILEVAREFKEFRKIIIVTGAAYQITEGFMQLVASDPRIDHRNNLVEQQILNAMLEAELVIVPASGVLMEALAAGCRLITGIYADNQKFVYSSFSLMKLIIDASDFSATNTRNAIKKALGSKSENRQDIDGNSPKRLKAIFFEIICTLRKANLNDCELLFIWANDLEVRKNAVSKETIIWDNHLKWFNVKITSDKSKIFILEINEIPAGQIRYDLKGNDWVIDYSISTLMRGKGLGKVITKLSLRYFEGQTIKALVQGKNIASKCVFKSIGFKLTRSLEINSELYNEFSYTP